MQNSGVLWEDINQSRFASLFLSELNGELTQHTGAQLCTSTKHHQPQIFHESFSNRGAGRATFAYSLYIDQNDMSLN